MPSIALKVCLDTGTITKTLRVNSDSEIYDVCDIIEEKMSGKPKCEDYGLFLTATNEMNQGVWLEPDKTLNYYMLKDGDTVYYMNKYRNQRLRMLDGTVKTMRLLDSEPVSNLMIFICSKLGIINHDEYGLYRYEDDVELGDEKSVNSASSTLSRDKGQKTLERDAKMEQLRKKLKIDEDEHWLENSKTLREQGVEVGKTLLLKRRLFYSDRNIDSRDPIQLNLLYNQARDAILDGTHPITVKQACHFAGIQCKIHFGNYDPEKHTPQFIQSNLSEFLPQHYVKVRGIERKILKEHLLVSSQSSENSSINDHEAKCMYTRTARALPTYGVTFFLVKEKQKKKKKLVPRLLGINAESVLRLDENTKEILQIWPLHQLQKWAPTTTTFTLNFGEYSPEPYICQTTESLRIMDVLNSYISIILKKSQDKEYIHVQKQGQVFNEVVESSRINIVEHTRCGFKKENTQDIVATKKMESCKQNEGKEFIEATIIKPPVGKVFNEELVTQIRAKQSTVPKLLNKITSNADYILNCIDNKSSQNSEGIKEAVNNAKGDLKMLLQSLEDKENNHLDENDKVVILEQLRLLQESIQTLSDYSTVNMCPEKIQTAADTLREASIKLYFTIVPSTKRRSQLLLASRNSFIVEENESNTRMSQIFSGHMDDLCDNINKIQNQIEKDFCTDVSQKDGTVNIEIVENLPKIHAALYCLLAAHADEKNIDNFAALTSLNTISELLPGIVIASNKLNCPENLKNEFKVSVKTLVESLKNKYVPTETTHPEDIFAGYENFAKTSRKVLHCAYPNGNKIQLYENEIIRLTKSVGRNTLNLLKNAHNALQTIINCKLANAIDDSGIKCTEAGRRLNVCSQLSSPCIQDINCQSSMRGAIEGMSSCVSNFSSTWQPLKKLPEYKLLSDNLTCETIEVEKALDELRNFLSNSIDVDSKEIKFMLLKTSENNDENMLRNTMNTAKKIVSVAEMKLIQCKNLLKLDTKESEEMRKQISNSIPILNATMIDLFLTLSDPSGLDYYLATKLVKTIASLIPDLSKNAYHLLFDVNSANFNLVRSWLVLIMDIFNSDGFNFMDKRPELIKFGETTAAILHSICDNVNMDNKINRANAVKDITSKTMKLLNQKFAIIQSLEDTDTEHALEKVILKCHDAVENFGVCAKIAEPTLSHSVCQNSIRSSSIILKNQLSELQKLISEESVYCDETLCAIDTLNEFISQYDIQAIEAMLSSFKEKCDNYTNSPKYQDLSDSIKKIDSSLSTFKNLSNEKLSKKDNSKYNTENKKTDDQIKDIIDEINVESLQFIATAQDSEVQNDDTAVKHSILKLIHDLQLYKNFNHSFEVCKQLNDYIRQLSHAAINIDVYERKVKENQDDDTLQNELKSALEVGKKNWNEVNNYIQNLNVRKSSRGSVIVSVTQVFVNSILSSTDKIVKDKDPKNVLKATTTLISVLEDQANGQDNKICNKYFKSYANQFIIALKDLETNKKPLIEVMGRVKSTASNLSKEFELKAANVTNYYYTNDLTTVSEDYEISGAEKIHYCKENSTNVSTPVVDASRRAEDQIFTGIRLNAAMKWLQNPALVKFRVIGQGALSELLKYFKKISEEMHGEEKNKFTQTLAESQQLFINCSKEVDENKSRKLLQLIIQLKEASELASVSGVVENNEKVNLMESEMKGDSENKVTPKKNIEEISNIPVTGYLVSSSDKTNPNIRKHITQHLQLVKRLDENSLKLLTNIHNVTKTLNGSQQAEAIETAGIQCKQASTKLNICAEMAENCINDKQCRIDLLKAIAEMSLAIDKLESACKPLKVLPPTKVLGNELVNNTREVRIGLNDLKKIHSTDGIIKDMETVPHKGYEKNSLVVNLMNAMKIAYENILTAESKLAELKTLPTTCQEELQIMRIQISNIIATVNAAMVDLFLASSGLIEADYLTATNAVHIMANLIPELSLNVYNLLNEEREIDNFNILNYLVKAYLDLFNNFDGFLSSNMLLMQLHKKIAILKCGQITGAVLQKVCKNSIREKEIHTINSVELIVTKTKKLFNNKKEILELLENNNDKNIEKNILKCVEAAEHLEICAKITAPTISYSICQNSIRLLLLLLKQKITTFKSLLPETSLFYEDASNILKLIQEFDFEFKVQAIDNLVYHLKDKCGKVKKANIKHEFTKCINEIDNSLATLKILSNQELISEPSSSKGTMVDVSEHINDVFNSINNKINRATSMLFEIVIEDNKASSIKNNIWEYLTKHLKLYIHYHDSLNERKHVTDYVYKLQDCALNIDLAEYNFEGNQNDTTKQIALKTAIDDAVNNIKEVNIYINTLNEKSSSETKLIKLYPAEILKRNQHGEIIILSKYLMQRLRDKQINISSPKPCENIAQKISDEIFKIEANKIPINEGITNLKKIVNELIEEFKLIDGVTNDTNKSEQIEDNDTTFIEMQLIAATKWLKNPVISKYKSSGQDAVKNLIDIFVKVSKEINEEEKSEFIEILDEVQTLFTICSKKVDLASSRLLLDKVLELKVNSEKAIVSILVKNFMKEEVLCTNIQSLLASQLEGNSEDAGEKKNKFALKDNINLLLEHLSRLEETEYLALACGKKYQKPRNHVTKIQLFGPQLLEKAELNLKSSDNKALKDFDLIFQKYNESIACIKNECDQSVDPLMFVRAVGMLIRNNKNIKDDPIRPTDTSNITLRLIKRVVLVCDSVSSKTKDTELQKSLEEAQVNLNSVLKDGADSEGLDSAKIIRKTEELEAALGGDIVFRKMPENNEPIFVAAHALHSCVKQWSARENDIVEAARKAAVLMAKLSNSISQDDKAISITTSKNIVEVSNDVTRLARKLAEECTDIRIRNNLLQCSDQLPTISGQLKMLASVKTYKYTEQCSSSKTDKEAMTMLVDNAQNLMLSIQEVVKAAAAASVKIQSQRGVGNMKWIRARSRIY